MANIIIFFIKGIMAKVQAFFKKNKAYAMQVLLLILWLLLFILNYITIRRLIIFFIILLIIYCYKQAINKVKLMKPIKKKDLLILLMNFDKAKLVLISFIIYVYMRVFDLLEWGNSNKLIKLLE
jgi:hypothetical protein